MDRSISQGRVETGDPGASVRPDDVHPAAREEHARGAFVAIGLGLVVLSLVIYTFSNHDRNNFYNHFVWQASAWLDGQAAIPYPVVGSDASPGNDYFQDVLPVEPPTSTGPGRALIPFPPLPAVVLLPFVAIWGLWTNAQLVATVIGALDVGIAYWMLGRLPLRPSVRLASTVFLAFGTVLWYAAELGTTWFFAHVVAVGLTLLAIGIALDADESAWRDAGGRIDERGDGARRDEARDPIDDQTSVDDVSGKNAGGPSGVRTLLGDLVRAPVDRRQVLAGLLLGLAATSRLSVIFGLPFFVLVGGGGNWLRRGLSACIGAALPVAGLLLYNLVTSGHLFHPGYDYLYHLEAVGYPFLHYNPSWSIEDPRYIPQNLEIMLTRLPDILPGCPPGASREIFGTTCPYVVPNQVGMSLILTSPGWLLALPALRRYAADRIVTGATIAILLIAALNLMHFSQGWVQFGYRFSNDFAPFALLLVALALQWSGRVGRIAIALILVSIAMNAWGVAWANILGW